MRLKRHIRPADGILALLCCAALAGCADRSDDPPVPRVPQSPTATAPGAGGEAGIRIPPSIVSDDAIRRVKAGTPQRALLQWWQAVQFRDVDAAKEHTSRAAYSRMGEARFRAAVLRVGDNSPGLRILSARAVGGRASIRSLLVYYDSGKPGKPTSAPRSFRMARQGVQWRLRDLEFLTDLDRKLRATQG